MGKFKCGCDVHLKKKIAAMEKKRKRGIKASNKLRYLDMGEVYKLNPWVGSLLSDSALNLDAFGGKFRVYFADKTNAKLNVYFNEIWGYIPPLKSWTNKEKNDFIESMSMVSAFLNVNVEIVNNYDLADYVMLKYELDGALAFTFLPDTVYTNPDIFFDKIIVQFDSIYLSELITTKGSFMWETMSHEFCHTLGLIHPFDGYYGITMPGLGTQELTNKGLNSQGTNLTTFMSYVGHFSNNDDYGWSQTLMPADMESLRFSYQITGISDKYLKYMDYSLGTDIMQVVCSGKDGCDLNLVPLEYDTSTFNLNLDGFRVNPQNGGCMTGYGSGDGLSFGETNIFDKECYVRSITNGYSRMTVSFGRLLGDSTMNVIVDGSYLEFYINGSEEEFRVEVNVDNIEITDRITGKIMSVIGGDIISLVQFNKK